MAHGPSWDYTTWLTFLVPTLALVLVVRFSRTDGRGTMAMRGSSAEESDR